MAYLRCTECGSKALTAASQCPRCAHPFNLRDVRGERVKLVQCRGCGIMHRFDTPCHWCGDLPSAWQLSAVTSRRVAAVALMLAAVGGMWRYQPELLEFISVVQNSAAIAEASNTEAAGQAPAAVVGAASSTPLAAADSVSGSSAAGVVQQLQPGDTVVWTPAVARTWVNVRADASRGGEVVGVIKPASRAMLGSDSAGWRQVRLSDVKGWVDPRLFEADSTRTRSE